MFFFLNPAVFANVDTPYPPELMKFLGCGRENSLQASEAMAILAEYRKTLNPFPEPSSRKGSSNKPEVIAYRQEAERIREMFQKKEEEYCAAKNPISSYEDIVKLPISDFANILQKNYFYGNQFAFNSMEAILDC
ncbi:hypothetical protein F542_14080 [Bibersteinia trehalosi USDA-ARS-USMARC-188]|uniref:Uncharacterized protein n=3 Tax=Bibersteinia trehalosi TaxID=47735 RepID=A0A4V7IAV2_BIBTR|nr:hypothetical protein [Bibersteinia trehalosi]AHG82126.1 hypothetical protein F542_14080 [Bibersteinia trehalosi USDA-ARS-USMARC-188]AHG84434.1 hypothetical protein F543_15700 [Bibersteinia trehalosi USDA-ARS-USMARC-189]